MTEKQKQQFEEIVASGKLTPEQVEKLRAGLEKPPRHYDHAKSAYHMDTVKICQTMERYAPNAVSVSWEAEGTGDDGNAYIYIAVSNGEELSGMAKELFDDAVKRADAVRFDIFASTFTLIFKDIITENSQD